MDMVFALFSVLTILFLWGYQTCGKDFFAPTVFQTLTFMVASLACAYFIYDSGLSYEIHWNTFILLSTCFAMSTGIGVFVHQLFFRIRITAKNYEFREISSISITKSLLVLGLLLATMIWKLNDIQRYVYGSDGFLDAIFQYRQLTSHSNDLEADTPFLLGQLQGLAQVFFILFFYNLIYFYKKLSRSYKIMNSFVISVCMVVELLCADRSTVINSVIACVIVYHMLRIKKMNGYKTYKTKSVLKMLLFCCLVLVAFVLVRRFVGRGTKGYKGILNYLSVYIGAPTLNLDIYLQNPDYNTDVFGKYTFYKLLDNLRSLGADIPQYTVHQKYIYMDGVSLGNVYTAFMIYFSDFGIAGVYILHGIASLIISIIYEYVKKYRGNLSILFISMIYYSFAVTFFTERFYSSLISMLFAEKMVLLIIIYRFLMISKRRFVFSRYHKCGLCSGTSLQ